jgi:transposase InsO family protein
LIYTNIYVLITLGSFSANEYFIIFIDDYLRKCYVYFFEKKSKIFMTFKKSKVMIEKMMRNNIRSLRLDKGGEYISNKFKSYCEKYEIHRYLTAPYTSHHNGIVERKNRTILNMVKSMIKIKEMPK